jgi:hypothetical protein
MPGQPGTRSHAVWIVPGDSLSRIVGLPLALPQSFRKLKKLSRFHCRHFAAGRSCPQ